MPIPFVLIDLTSVTGYVTDVSDIYTSSKDPTETPVKYFDFMVHSKEKVTRAVCFSLLKRPFVTSLNGVKNEGIECKNFRASDSNNYLLSSFSKVSKVSLNDDKKELLLETQSIVNILNSCSICERVNIEAVIIKLSAKENISSTTSVLFVRKAVAHDNTGSIEISFYNDAADEISDGKCYKAPSLTLNTYKSERILKSSARTEVTLAEHAIL